MTTRSDKGFVLHVDGIDGAGKSTVLAAARSWAEQRGLRVFDATQFSKEHGYLPTIQDIGDADVLLTAEPTHAGVGKVIREGLIVNGTTASARTTANAFALDRMILIEKTIKPFLAQRAGRLVFQDRGLFTSLAYQPLQSERFQTADPVTAEQILHMDGNQFALDHAPDAFIFLDVDAEEAARRLAGRSEKTDDAIFEEAEFQLALSKRYRDPNLFRPLADRGTTFLTLDGGKSREAVAEDMQRLLDQLIPLHG